MASMADAAPPPLPNVSFRANVRKMQRQLEREIMRSEGNCATQFLVFVVHVGFFTAFGSYSACSWFHLIIQPNLDISDAAFSAWDINQG